ncbi:MAG: DUF1877 domain-containing protein [Candidatus Leucobacter sulfamidivorax]|nr:DUF1877 domain-containing protein [Candidatus Leucobacter sulfamidivorax]
MGIRYYAYAFDHELSDQARENPRSLVSSDPLADAWGLVPHATISHATFEQTVPERDMLYLDKAWRELQILTGPRELCGTARPAFAMFAGEVRMHDLMWEPWVRPLFPADLPEIERDLADLVRDEAERIPEASETVDARGETFVMHFLRRAHEFVAGLVADGRGMVYMIG